MNQEDWYEDDDESISDDTEDEEDTFFEDYGTYWDRYKEQILQASYYEWLLYDIENRLETNLLKANFRDGYVRFVPHRYNITRYH